MIKTKFPLSKAASLALAVLVLLAGCFSLTSCGGGAGENGEINILCYGDYMDQNIISDFEAETGIKVVLDTYDTAEELYTIISKSSAKYDAICTSDYMLEKLMSEDKLAELNKDNLPDLANIDEIYMTKSAEFDPGNKYTVPYQVGVAGIAYNKTMVDGKVDSWDVLWDEKYSQQIVMPDSVRDAFMIALMRDGKSLNSTDEAEIRAAEKALIAQKPLVYSYSNDATRDRLIDGSAAIGVVWNGEYDYMTSNNEDIEFSVPKEGSEFFIDSWAVTADAANQDGAESWINYLCKAEVAAANFDYLYYTCPNKAAYELIDQEAFDNSAIFPDEETLSRCRSLRNLPQEAIDIYADAWKKVKAN